MEYVRGIPAMTMKAGKPSRRSVQSMSTTSVIMRKPTITRAPQVAALLTTEITGAKNAARMKRMPVKTDVRPVRPPSAAPEADSTKVVMEEAPKRPPTAAAAESAIRISRMFSTVPSSFRNSPCLATAIAVPMVSKKSDIMRENAKTRRIGVVRTFTTATVPVESAMKGAPKEEKSRAETMPEGICVTPRGIPQSTAMMMPMRMEPLMFIE